MGNTHNTQPVLTPATHKRIVLIHKADGSKPSKITKVALEASHKVLELARVRRPGLEAFIESGEFLELEAVPQPVIDNPDRRKAEYPTAFYVIEESDMGRPPKNGERDYDSTAQSILLWLKKHYAETEKPLLRIGELSVIVEIIEQ